MTHGTVDGAGCLGGRQKIRKGAKALLLHFVSKESQEIWAVGQGASGRFDRWWTQASTRRSWRRLRNIWQA